MVLLGHIVQKKRNSMKSIEERAKEYAENQELVHSMYEFEYCQKDYIVGANDQKSIDDEVIKKLTSIMEHSAPVLGIGTKWFNENARQIAIEELRQEIRNYLLD